MKRGSLIKNVGSLATVYYKKWSEGHGNTALEGNIGSIPIGGR